MSMPFVQAKSHDLLKKEFYQVPHLQQLSVVLLVCTIQMYFIDNKKKSVLHVSFNKVFSAT
jgi:hypothetical protein